jgi:hypothetical protein
VLSLANAVASISRRSPNSQGSSSGASVSAAMSADWSFFVNVNFGLRSLPRLSWEIHFHRPLKFPIIGFLGSYASYCALKRSIADSDVMPAFHVESINKL